MGMPWDMKMAEWVGKAAPNEMSKAAPVLRYIPYVGWVASGIAAADASATAYSDIYKEGRDRGLSSSQARGKAIMPAFNAVGTTLSQGSDPGQYGSSGNKMDTDWSRYLGMAGGLYNAAGGGSGGGLGTNMNLSGLMGGGMGLANAIGGNTYGTDIYTGRGQNQQAQSYALNTAYLLELLGAKQKKQNQLSMV